MNDRYKEKNPFSVPEGYFEGLTDRIVERVGAGEAPTRAGLWQLVRPYVGMAAMFAVVMFVMRAVVPVTPEGEGTPETVAGVEEEIFDSGFNPTNEEIIEYLEAEVDSYELMFADMY